MTKPGYGSIDNPFPLNTAVSDARVEPGDTIYLRAGTYNGAWAEDGDFIISISGTAENPIVFEPYHDEQVIINGTLRITGSNIIINGKYQLSVAHLDTPTRETQQIGSVPTDIPIGTGINVYGSNVQLRNVIVHDASGNGVGLWGSSVSQTMYGCVVYNCGWDAPDRGHGHLIYSNGADSTRLIKNNVLFNGFELCLKVYTENTNIDGYTVLGNTMFGAGLLDIYEGPNQKYWNLFIGSIDNDISAEDETIQNNRTYHTVLALTSNLLGYNGGIGNSTVTGNKFVGPVAMRITNEELATLTMTGNTFAGTLEEFTALEYPTNTYATFANLGNTVHVEANECLTTAALVTIYNQAEANTVDVDLTAVTGLSAGSIVTVRNVQDWFNDTQTLTLDANKIIAVNMQAVNRTIAAPIEWTAVDKTFPRFGVFVVL